MSWQKAPLPQGQPFNAPRPVKPAAPAPRPPVPTEPDFLMRFLGKRVTVQLIFSGEVAGVLHAFSKYEISVVQADGTEALVFKNSIALISEAKP